MKLFKTCVTLKILFIVVNLLNLRNNAIANVPDL